MLKWLYPVGEGVARAIAPCVASAMAFMPKPCRPKRGQGTAFLGVRPDGLPNPLPA